MITARRNTGVQPVALSTSWADPIGGGCHRGAGFRVSLATRRRARAELR